MSAKKIVVCDDHMIVTEGLELLFKDSSQFSLVGQSANGKELLDKLDRLKPDILLLDLNLKDTDGFSLLSEIRKRNKDLLVIILTMYQDDVLIQRAQKEGANGYLLKSASNKELLEALERVNTQSFYLSRSLKNEIEQRQKFRDHFANKMKLTRREAELIPLLASGKSSASIARELNVSAYTIETHRKNIFKKLKINNIIELVNFAHENKLL
jgi:DNA-binding NarL/FixJ family response regulator